MRRAIISTAKQHVHELQEPGFRTLPVLVTLTYANPDAWSSRHVTRFLKMARRFTSRRGYTLRYAWVAELTKAGRVHFHALLFLRADIRLPKPDEAGWWTHGMTKIEVARCPVGYLAKYASKGSSQNELPKGLRIHGRGGLSSHGKLQVAWWTLPRYQRERCTPIDRAARAPGGGWISRLTGEWWPPWDADIVEAA